MKATHQTLKSHEILKSEILYSLRSLIANYVDTCLNTLEINSLSKPLKFSGDGFLDMYFSFYVSHVRCQCVLQLYCLW